MAQVFMNTIHTNAPLRDEDYPAKLYGKDYIYLLLRLPENAEPKTLTLNITSTNQVRLYWLDGRSYLISNSFTGSITYDNLPFSRVIDGVNYRQFWLKIVGDNNTISNVNVNSNDFIVDACFNYTCYGNVSNRSNNLKRIHEYSIKGYYDDYDSRLGFKNVEVIDEINAPNVTRMDSMFRDCTSLTSVPLFDTSKVTSMSNMFVNCTSLTEIPNFDTSNVTSMSNMFYNCSSLTSVPNFDTSNVINMYSMFRDCTSLTSVPLFDTSKVINMGYMFAGCFSLTEIPLFDTSNVTSMYSMFVSCTALTDIPLFDTSKVTNMSNMFVNCTSLTEIPNFDTSNVTDMYGMFVTCTSLTSIPNFDTSNVTDMASMFYGCTSLISVAVFDTSNVIHMGYMFSNCTSLENVTINNCNEYLSSVYRMFENCTSLKTVSTLFLRNWVSDSDNNLFYGCTALESADLRNISQGIYDLSISTNLTADSINDIISYADSGNTQSNKIIVLSQSSGLINETLANEKGWLIEYV